MNPLPSQFARRLLAASLALPAWFSESRAQIPAITQGFLNEARAEAPGTLINRPYRVTDSPANGNDTRSLGRTTTINYFNGWLVVGAEGPGSASPYDLDKRVFDISNPDVLVRRRPSDFGLTYPGNFWLQNSDGWNAHGTAQYGNLLLPNVLRVQSFGAPVELGGTGNVPGLANLPLLYDRSSQAGPWAATMLWYGTPSQTMQIRRPRLTVNGVVNDPGDLLASFDHVGNFGGGDWHPIFFGDLLIYARSGSAASDGVVVYRLTYNNFHDANPLNDTITPQLVGTLQGGFEGYWPNLFSDGTGLYVIGSATDILTSANITGAVDPALNTGVTQGPTLTLPGFSNASYPVYQDRFGFIHNRKINMTQFLAGQGLSSVVLTLNETANGVDTTQMSLPLGNLWITGGYPNAGLAQGMGIWVHQQAPDTTRPAVTYHVPQANRANYPRFAPLSFMLHEHPRHGGMRNGVDFAVRPVGPGDGSLGAAVPGFLLHDFAGVVTFTPEAGLAASTTYQVDFFSDNSNPLNPIGFFDAANNPVEPYSFRFSTGETVNANPPPSFNSLVSNNYQPLPGAPFTVTAGATGSGDLTYRFDFTGTWSDWGSSASAQHTYATAGRRRVLAQVRDGNGSIVTRTLNVLVTTPPAGPLPTQSSSLSVGLDGPDRNVWSVNPDANTVTVLDATTGAFVAEHAVGSSPRSVARDALGRRWITCMASDEIRVLNSDGSTAQTLALPYGSAPFGVAASPDGQSLFVTLYGSGRLHRYSAANPAAVPVVRTTFPTPRAIAVSGDGQRVLVTRFLSPDLEAEVAEFDGDSPDLALVRTFRLASANTTDNGDRAAGVPNYLAGVAISPDGTRAAIVSKQDNIQRGTAFGVPDLTFETTVRSVVSFLNLQTNSEIPNLRRDFDNSDSPSAVAYSPLGDTLLVTLQGNNRVVGLDTLGLTPVTGYPVGGSTVTSPAVKTLEAETGRAPQGLLVDAATQRVFVQNFMGRSVSVFNAQPLLAENQTSLPTHATTNTVGNELLSETVLTGKRLFYNAADSRMSAEGYISCATCHLDGGHDGRVWDFTGRGEGLRRTTDLRGRLGMGHGNVHWSANFDEIQDFEHDMRGPFGGTGFLPLSPSQFAAQHASPTSAKAGLSADLDALAAYVTSLSTASVPRSPHRNPDGSLTAAALLGREVFADSNCASCHSGNRLTNSALTTVGSPSLSAVGTTSGLSGQRLGAALTGIDTPTLQGLHAVRTFLHHGQAATLADVFAYTGGTLLLPAQAQLLGAPSVYFENETPAQGGGGFLRGALGGSAIHITGNPGNGVRFSAVNGGTGGAARISLRHARQYGDGAAVLRVNGVNHPLSLLRQSPDNGWMLSGWRWVTADVTLNQGTDNIVEVLRASGEFDDFPFNALLVSNASDLTAAQPHRVVQTLDPNDQANLFTYLRQLDGTPGEAPVLPSEANVNVSLAVSPGTGSPLTAPFVDFDVVFAAAVTGLDTADFSVGGTAGATLRNLSAVSPGTHFRLRLTGFTQAGTITVQLPAGLADGPTEGSVNNASNQLVLTYAPPVLDDIAVLSDEFADASTLSNWFRNETVEGWNAGKLEQWDINTSTAGRMRLMPYASSWYQDFTGAYTYKEITGDFVLTTRLNVGRRNGQPGRPTSDYSLCGLMVRASRGFTQCAPQPSFGSGVVLPYPPPAFGQPNHYVTDWQPASENYIFLSFGFGNNSVNNNANQWQYEVKTTVNGVSTLYPRAHGVPLGVNDATLQIVRRGSTFLLLRRHGEAGAWIVENRFERPDLPATLQVGLTTYTDWNTVAAGWNYVSPVQPFHQNRIVNTGLGNPDVVADVDFVRLRRPDPALTAGALQAAPVTGPDGPVASLAGSPLETVLGSAALDPVTNPATTFEQWLAQTYSPAQLVNPALTDPQADPDADGFPNALEFAFGLNPALGNDGSHAPRGEVSSGQLRLSYRRPVGGVSGVTYSVETRTTALTADGLGWTTAAPGADYTVQTTNHGDGTETVTVIFSNPVGTRQFSRLAVSF